jgi:hypothetical protein
MIVRQQVMAFDIPGVLAPSGGALLYAVCQPEPRARL